MSNDSRLAKEIIVYSYSGTLCSHVKKDTDPFMLVWSHVHHVLVCEKERPEVCVWYIIICEKKVYVCAKNVFRRIYKKLVIVIPSGEGICCLGKEVRGRDSFHFMLNVVPK